MNTCDKMYGSNFFQNYLFPAELNVALWLINIPISRKSRLEYFITYDKMYGSSVQWSGYATV